MNYIHHFRSVIDEAECIILRGSRSEGLHREDSDVDATIIAENPSVIGRNKSCYKLAVIDGFPTEMLILTRDEYNERAISLTRGAAGLGSSELHELHRLAFGQTIYGDDALLGRNSICEIFRKLYLDRRKRDLISHFRKIQLVKNEEDTYQYLYYARAYVEALLEAVLVAKRDMYIRKPYLFARLSRTFGAESKLLNMADEVLFKMAADGTKGRSSLADEMMKFGAKVLRILYFDEQDLLESSGAESRLNQIHFTIFDESPDKAQFFVDSKAYEVPSEKTEAFWEAMASVRN